MKTCILVEKADSVHKRNEEDEADSEGCQNGTGHVGEECECSNGCFKVQV